MKKVNLQEEVNKGEIYEYREIGRLNGHMLNVVKVQNRTLDFHVHEASDELFQVLDGSFILEFEDGKVPLSEGDIIIVPKGTKHRPVCTGLVKILLMDLSGALNNDNCGGSYSK
ncbi:MAG: cupin domain-containing protein [Clostridiales bacterium]|nr:cupin domain-containing protein [Clostridiales bacterium]